MLFFMQVGREFQVQKALFSAGFPVPQPLLHSTDVEVIGTEFYLMEHVKVSCTTTAKSPVISPNAVFLDLCPAVC